MGSAEVIFRGEMQECHGSTDRTTTVHRPVFRKPIGEPCTPSAEAFRVLAIIDLDVGVGSRTAQSGVAAIIEKPEPSPFSGSCGTVCAGVFENNPGSWGARRLPVRISDFS